MGNKPSARVKFTLPHHPQEERAPNWINARRRILEATFTWVPVGTPLISLCLTLLVHIWKAHTPKEEKKTKGGEGRNRRDCSWCMAWRRDCWGPGWAWHIMPGSELKRGQFGLLDMGVIIITNPWVCRSKGLGMCLMSFGVTLLDAHFWMGWNRVTGGQI